MSFPQFMFSNHVGPPHTVFAWFPVRTYYGRWVWMRRIVRQRIQKKAWLDGPDWAFWAYALPEDKA